MFFAIKLSPRGTVNIVGIRILATGTLKTFTTHYILVKFQDGKLRYKQGEPIQQSG
jgi:hypothetical protein